MEYLLFLFTFLIGASIGSFLSVLLARLGQREGIVAGRSECPQCGSTLKWFDLIPVVSFVLLRRRCRQCKASIPWSYLILELAAGFSLATLLFKYDFAVTPETVFLTLMLAGFIALFFFDYTYFVLPDRITWPLIFVALAYRIIFSPALLTNTLITGFVLAAIFAILYLLSGGAWIGFGDVKLMILLGLVFGYPVGLWVVILAIWLAAIVGIGMILIGKATSQTALPFGSFLTCVAVIIIIFYHESELFFKLFF